MIGFQDLIIKNNIKVYDLAKEIQCNPCIIYKWFRNNRVPKSHLKILAEKFNVREEYLNKKVNDINTYQPKKKGFCNEYIIENEVTKIILKRKNKEDLITIIDTEDLEKLIQFDHTWCSAYKKNTDSYYAHSNIRNIDGKHSVISLQTFLMNPDQNKNIKVDHINHDSLNNRKGNLRTTVNDKNTKNRKGRNSNNKSGYRNVSKRDNWWVVQIQIEGKNTVLKKFPLDQLEEAGKYAEEMRQKYYGDFAGKG